MSMMPLEIFPYTIRHKAARSHEKSIGVEAADRECVVAAQSPVIGEPRVDGNAQIRRGDLGRGASMSPSPEP